MNDREILAKNLTNLMKINNITRRELCIAIGVKYSTLSEWLRGERYPRIEAIRKIVSFFEISLHDLIGNDENTQYKFKYLKLLKRIEKEIDKSVNVINLNGVKYIKIAVISKVLERK